MVNGQAVRRPRLQRGGRGRRVRPAGRRRAGELRRLHAEDERLAFRSRAGESLLASEGAAAWRGLSSVHPAQLDAAVADARCRRGRHARRRRSAALPASAACNHHRRPGRRCARLRRGHQDLDRRERRWPRLVERRRHDGSGHCGEARAWPRARSSTMALRGHGRTLMVDRRAARFRRWTAAVSCPQFDAAPGRPRGSRGVAETVATPPGRRGVLALRRRNGQEPVAANFADFLVRLANVNKGQNGGVGQGAEYDGLGKSLLGTIAATRGGVRL